MIDITVICEIALPIKLLVTGSDERIINEEISEMLTRTAWCP